MYSEGIPLTAFLVDDINAEYARLQDRGVEFTGAPQRFYNETMVLLDDICGSLIMIYQSHED